MARINLYKKIPIEELKKVFEKSVVDISTWFEQNPKRRICRASWVYGETFKVRKKHVREDIEKMYQKTKLEEFKN